MTYDKELILIGETITQDEIGQEIKVPNQTTILCGLKSIGRNEFYSAAQIGLKPSLIFTIHTFEYSGETKVLYENQEYKVIKTYSIGNEEIELTCERVGVNG